MKKQVRNADTRRALAKTCLNNDEAYLDNAADTFRIGGTAWIVESLSGKTVHIEGYSKDATSSNVPIGNAVTAFDLPDGVPLNKLLKVLCDNKSVVKNCTLLESTLAKKTT